MQKEIVVSISCITYNHDCYIADAIESFLMQKTDFPYEILIHDDASTDRTPVIIREYVKKHPDLIQPVFQTENQYSQGIEPENINQRRAKGKYIAICEGDDFWTDPYKLQKQVDCMEKNPSYSLCVHASNIFFNKKKIRPVIRPYFGNKLFTVEEIIQGYGNFATSSMLFPSVFIRSLPDFFKMAPVSDYPLKVYLSLQGGVYYIDEFMSAHRKGVKGSWSDRMNSKPDKRADHHHRSMNMLKQINQFTECKYDDAVKKTIKSIEFNFLLNQNKFREAKEEYKETYVNLDFTSKAKIFIKQYFPAAASLLIKIKRKFFND